MVIKAQVADLVTGDRIQTLPTSNVRWEKRILSPESMRVSMTLQPRAHQRLDIRNATMEVKSALIVSDNDTVLGWWEKAAEPVKAFARKELPQIDDIVDAMIECAFRSIADTAIVPMQDFLHLGGGARMNYPGTVGGNWRWRMLTGAMTDALADGIRRLNDRTGRTASVMEGNR